LKEKTEYSGPYFPSTWFEFSAPMAASACRASVVHRCHYNEYTSKCAARFRQERTVWTATMVTRQTVSGENAIKSTVQAVVKALAETNLLRR
jgi:hypothetical protein